jgi:hypothetical protein
LDEEFCKYCQDTVPGGTLSQHLLTHRETGKRFRCKGCSKQFPKACVLKTHQEGCQDFKVESESESKSE